MHRTVDCFVRGFADEAAGEVQIAHILVLVMVILSEIVEIQGVLLNIACRIEPGASAWQRCKLQKVAGATIIGYGKRPALHRELGPEGRLLVQRLVEPFSAEFFQCVDGRFCSALASRFAAEPASSWLRTRCRRLSRNDYAGDSPRKRGGACDQQPRCHTQRCLRSGKERSYARHRKELLEQNYRQDQAAKAKQRSKPNCHDDREDRMRTDRRLCTWCASLCRFAFTCHYLAPVTFGEMPSALMPRLTISHLAVGLPNDGKQKDNDKYCVPNHACPPRVGAPAA